MDRFVIGNVSNDRLVEVMLTSWTELQDPNGVEKHIFRYRHETALNKDAMGKPVEEDLSKHFTLQNTLLHLMWFYSDTTFTMSQIRRCHQIFTTLLVNATYMEAMTDEKMDIGWEDYHKPGVFSILRSEVLQFILNAPRLHILCYNLSDESRDGSVFQLLQLLQDDVSFGIFQEFWNSRPNWRGIVETAGAEKLPVAVNRQSGAIKSADKTIKFSLNMMSMMAANTHNMEVGAVAMYKRLCDTQQTLIEQLQNKLKHGAHKK